MTGRDTGTGAGSIFINNSSVSNGQNAFRNADNTTKDIWIFDYNNYYGHGTELYGITAGAHDTGDADPLFTSAVGGDFTVTTGSPLLDAGMQIGTELGATGDYKMNIGVDQDDVTAAGGGSGGAGHVLVF
jgi:hypothetical protein